MNSGCNFIAIDVETANKHMSSICQIGIVKYIDGELTEEWSTLINPEESFNPININIHGITSQDVADSPTFPQVAKELDKFMNNAICVSHTHFDRISICQACSKYNLPEFNITWLDSTLVARRTWTEFSECGYGIANICDKIGFSFKHHDALEDAKATAYILIAAMKVSETNIDSWLKCLGQPIYSKKISNMTTIKREANHEGLFFGEVLVFTGELDISRDEAADAAASIGFSVCADVTRKTTILVVGDQDYSKLAGKEKSSKHRKAEELINKGQNLRILNGSDFYELVRMATKYESIGHSIDDYCY